MSSSNRPVIYEDTSSGTTPTLLSVLPPSPSLISHPPHDASSLIVVKGAGGALPSPTGAETTLRQHSTTTTPIQTPHASSVPTSLWLTLVVAIMGGLLMGYGIGFSSVISQLKDEQMDCEGGSLRTIEDCTHYGSGRCWWNGTTATSGEIGSCRYRGPKCTEVAMNDRQCKLYSLYCVFDAESGCNYKKGFSALEQGGLAGSVVGGSLLGSLVMTQTGKRIPLHASFYLLAITSLTAAIIFQIVIGLGENATPPSNDDDYGTTIPTKYLGDSEAGILYNMDLFSILLVGRVLQGFCGGSCCVICLLFVERYAPEVLWNGGVGRAERMLGCCVGSTSPKKAIGLIFQIATTASICICSFVGYCGVRIAGADPGATAEAVAAVYLVWAVGACVVAVWVHLWLRKHGLIITVSTSSSTQDADAVGETEGTAPQIRRSNLAEQRHSRRVERAKRASDREVLPPETEDQTGGDGGRSSMSHLYLIMQSDPAITFIKMECNTICQPVLRKRFALAFICVAAEQLTGINAAMFYSPQVTSAMGLDPLLGNFLVMLWNAVSCCGSLVIIRHWPSIYTLFTYGTLWASIGCGLVSVPLFFDNDTVRYFVGGAGIMLLIGAYEAGIGPSFYVVIHRLFAVFDQDDNNLPDNQYCEDEETRLAPPPLTDLEVVALTESDALGPSLTIAMQSVFSMTINFTFPVLIGAMGKNGLAIIFAVYCGCGLICFLICVKVLRAYVHEH